MPQKLKQLTVLLNAEEIGRLLLVSQRTGVRVPSILRSAINYYFGTRMLDPEAVRYTGGNRPPKSRVRHVKQPVTLPAAQVVARLQENTATSCISASDQRSTRS